MDLVEEWRAIPEWTQWRGQLVWPSAEIVTATSCDFGLNFRGYLIAKLRSRLWLPRKRESARVSLLQLSLPDFEPSKQVDHINCIKVDDRSANLLWMVKQMPKNALKKGPYRNNALRHVLGVYFHRASKKFHACINRGGLRKHLGSFDTSEAAATKFCAVVAEHFGA